MLVERLKRARKAAGLSLRAAGERVGVSQTAIKKYEDGVNTPDSMQLYRLAQAYQVRSEFFFRPLDIQLSGIEFRKRANTPKHLLNKIEAEVLNQLERWQELVNLYPEYPVKPFVLPDVLPEKIKQLDEIELLAERLREYWDLGSNPIADLVDTLESLGIWVLFTQTESSAKFDGLMAFHDKQPVIVVSANWPGDRQRFTLAHELGHLLLQNRLADELDEEKACNRFSGAFLLPQKALFQQMGRQVRNIELRELYLLKQEYGLSMLACLFRLVDNQLISHAVYKRTFMLFSKNGWRKQEPGDMVAREQSFLFKQLVYRALAENWASESKAAELLGMPLARFHQERKLERA